MDASRAVCHAAACLLGHLQRHLEALNTAQSTMKGELGDICLGGCIRRCGHSESRHAQITVIIRPPGLVVVSLVVRSSIGGRAVRWSKTMSQPESRPRPAR